MVDLPPLPYFRVLLSPTASLFPAEQYSFMINSQEEVELKDMQEYFALVSLMGTYVEKWGRGGREQRGVVSIL